MKVDELELQQGFEQFVAAARQLEIGYGDLKARVAAFDEERESIFAALPIGLVKVRGGTTTSCNREGERLRQLGSEWGVDLGARPSGEYPVGNGLVRVRRVELPDGELVMLEDRSRVRELEREVDRLDRLAGLSELALGIAHEIKNPLNGVLGFANLIERTDDARAQKRYAAKVSEGVRQVDRIVKSLLGFARPERTQPRMASIETIVGEAAAHAGVQLDHVALAGAVDATANADALVRVLANLLRNAAEAKAESPNGGGDPGHLRIEIEVAVRGRSIEITVRDNGPGIATELGARVLEPMVSTKARGSGLGLSLSSRVLAFLGGDLRLLNPGEPGAQFLVRLPLLEAA